MDSRRAAAGSRRRLIVNADDFGGSGSINQAVFQAHREGVLTSASLMVNGQGFEEAVDWARRNRTLGVGLHLTLVMGRSTLGPAEIPGLVNGNSEFSNDPVRAGMRYFWDRKLRGQLAREMGAQFEKFQATGLALDHVNGHLNLHLHPAIFRILLENAGRWGVARMRLTRDRFWLSARMARGRWGYRLSHGLIFFLLAGMARAKLRARDIRHTGAVFGLLQNGRVDEQYLLRLLRRLPAGDSELYSHPSLDQFRPEFDALVSPRVKSLMKEEAIELIRYQDL